MTAAAMIEKIPAGYRRLARYVGLWLWLIRYNIKNEPLLFASALFFGLFARVGSMIGLVISVRCAHWILSPNKIPAFLKPLAHSHPTLVLAIFIMIPGLVFLGIAVARVLQNSAGLRLRTTMSDKMSGALANKIIADVGEDALRAKGGMGKVVADVKIAHGKLVAVEGVITNLLITALGVFLAAFVGMMIDWMLMSAITAIGLVFAFGTASFRHLKSHALNKEQDAVRQRTQEHTQDISGLAANMPAEESIVERARGAMPEFIDSMSHQKNVDQNFYSQSGLIIDVGQAVIVMTFMSMLAGNTGADPAKIPMLITLAILFRFLSNYLQVLTHQVIKLGVHYPFLVDLREKIGPARKA